jgi:hypothetical protein
VHLRIHHASDAVGVTDVNSDLARWIRELVGQGDAGGLPTPENEIAFEVRQGDHDVAFLAYVTNDHTSWFRWAASVCASALRS